MNVAICSFRFNPGHLSHLIANCHLCAELGHTPYLFVTPELGRMIENQQYPVVTDWNREANSLPIDAAILWFPSLENIYFSLRLRVKGKTKLIYVLHEPFDSFANYLKSGFGIKKVIKIFMAALATLPVIRLADTIILPSHNAEALYGKWHRALNGNVIRIPLIYDDEASQESALLDKKLISYIGTAAEDHAYMEYLSFAHRCIRLNHLSDFRFLFATRSLLPIKARQLIDELLGSGRFRLLEGKPLSNFEINNCFRESIVIWNAYHRSVQSGVLPKAFMFGSAVVTLARNANEFTAEGKTAVYIDDNACYDQLHDAISKVVEHKIIFNYECRNAFLETFYYRAHLSQFGKLLEPVQ